MAPVDRRTFLKHVGGVIAATTLPPAARCWAAADETADLALTNGAIVTMQEKLPVAEALAVRGERILAVGSNAELKQLVGRTTKVVNLAGKSVSPGLIDAHSHLVAFGQMQLKFVLLRPPKVNSFDTLRSALAKAAREKPTGEWIVGRGFDTFKEGRFPRREELDEAVSKHPVLIIHWSGQYGVANTLALQKADLLRKDVEDPYGGKYLRDKRTGLPNGVLLHYPAIYSVYHPTLTEQEEAECATWALKQFSCLGVTCIHDNFCGVEHAKAYIRLERTGQLPCRLRVYPYTPNLTQCEKLVNNVRRYNGRLVRMQGVKLAVDGYALMYDVPEEHRELAIPMHPQAQFNEIIATIHRADFQVDVHAVGDKGVDWTLEAFAKASGSAAECQRRRHRIEHYPFRKHDTIERTAELGVPVCVQPNHIEVKADDIAKKLGHGGQKYFGTMVPLRSFAQAGVHVAFGADVPAFPSHAPLDSIRSAMERKTASGQQLDTGEAVSFLEALRMHTLGSAYAAFDEQDLGSLEAGKLADFVIWNQDLRQIKTGRDLAGLKPQATYVGGKAVHAAG